MPRFRTLLSTALALAATAAAIPATASADCPGASSSACPYTGVAQNGARGGGVDSVLDGREGVRPKDQTGDGAGRVRGGGVPGHGVAGVETRSALIVGDYVIAGVVDIKCRQKSSILQNLGLARNPRG